MARLLTVGFEGQALPGVGDASIDGEGIASGTHVITTSVVRSGLAALSMPSGSGALKLDFTGVLGRTYYVRAYLRVGTLCDVATAIIAIRDASVTTVLRVLLNTDGTLRLWSGSSGGGSQIGSDSAALSIGQWYRVELAVAIGTGAVDTADARIDGISFAAGTGLSVSESAIARITYGSSGFVTSPTSGQLYMDDVAINDDQGASQNSWPGEGKIVMLKPKADSARGANWLAGAGGTVNLWDAVDNTPPVGVAVASATDTSQVKNAAKDTTGLYDASVEAYDVAVASGGGGLVTADTVSLAQPVGMVGAGGAVAIQHGLAVASNPVVAEATLTTPASAAGTYPANWRFLPGTVTYAPTPTRGTRPVLRLRKGTSSTTAAMAALMGLLVEYVPAVTPKSLVAYPRVARNHMLRR